MKTSAMNVTQTSVRLPKTKATKENIKKLKVFLCKPN